METSTSLTLVAVAKLAAVAQEAESLSVQESGLRLAGVMPSAALIPQPSAEQKPKLNP